METLRQVCYFYALLTLVWFISAHKVHLICFFHRPSRSHCVRQTFLCVALKLGVKTAWIVCNCVRCRTGQERKKTNAESESLSNVIYFRCKKKQTNRRRSDDGEKCLSAHARSQMRQFGALFIYVRVAHSSKLFWFCLWWQMMSV